MGASPSTRQRAWRPGPKIRAGRQGPDGDDVEVSFSPDEDLRERVIFPITAAQANGIAEARFVELEDEGPTAQSDKVRAARNRRLPILSHDASVVLRLCAPDRRRADERHGCSGAYQ